MTPAIADNGASGAFTNVTSSDSIVLACQTQPDTSIQVSHSAITAVPVASVG